MSNCILSEATDYLNSLPRIYDIQESYKYDTDVLFLPNDIEISVMQDSNVILNGLDQFRDNTPKDLLRVIKIIDAINVNYTETNVLVPLVYAHFLDNIPWHITTQGFLTTRFTPELGKFIVNEEMKLKSYYGKHCMDYFWMPFSKKISDLKKDDIICIFNRRISGWDGSLDRPVIELLGAGGHLQCIWDSKKHKFVSRKLENNLQKEFEEEIGFILTSKDIDVIGGFVNSETHELVVLSNVIIPSQFVPQIQKKAIGNFSEDTDGIYMGSFEETIAQYRRDATFFAGGNQVAKTNFPYNDKIMKKFISHIYT